MRFASHSHPVAADEIRRFASQFDPQPFHLDAKAAAESMFGGLAASGWHTAAISMRLLVDSSPIAGGMVGTQVQVEWLHPVRPGDELRVQAEILEVRASRRRPDRGRAVLSSATLNQAGKVVQTLAARIMVPRKHRI